MVIIKTARKSTSTERSPPPSSYLSLVPWSQCTTADLKEKVDLAGPLQETLLLSKRKTNNLLFLNILGKAHTHNELFTKAEPKNERWRDIERRKGGGLGRKRQGREGLVSLSLNKKVLITVTVRFPLWDHSGQR